MGFEGTEVKSKAVIKKLYICQYRFIIFFLPYNIIDSMNLAIQLFTIAK